MRGAAAAAAASGAGAAARFLAVAAGGLLSAFAAVLAVLAGVVLLAVLPAVLRVTIASSINPDGLQHENPTALCTAVKIPSAPDTIAAVARAGPRHRYHPQRRNTKWGGS